MRSGFVFVVFVATAFSVLRVIAADPEPEGLPAAAEQTIDFARDIQAIFRERCYSYHGPETQEIRRLYRDLLGLPPGPDQVSAFLSDRRPDAFRRLVERVLESEHYGERWARHWRDLARGGQVLGKTDELGWSPVEDPVHINDWHATIMHLFGFDHHRLAVRFKGLNVRLTNRGGKVVQQLLA